MSDKHYSDDELVARLFGLGTADAHLDSCEFCSQRWSQFSQRHQLRHGEETEVPSELLAAQRRAIYARLGQTARKLKPSWLPLPAAALLLVLVAFIAFRPGARKPTADVISEDEALQEVFTVASRIDPASLTPVQSLFEVQK
jgi:hypothetical protein